MHTSWSPTSLDPQDIPGLWLTTVTIGGAGEERFQIIADNDPKMTYCPAERACRSKTARVNGPRSAGKEWCWCIQGAPGDVPGLWLTTVTLGSSGEEKFQIIADSDPRMTYF